ncbi:hypothetical protein Dsin_022596 [Dipteronia sinensis]|uniref:DNA2/NAM7 helicase helicase domain-containing protein n=1 Tax=Dipteronia sinensis TaxID=43782 RepID=A0AAE0E034_9ROSI|nr:hypothetical protein Dsin_022596 [Dipteronia sinensis]
MALEPATLVPLQLLKSNGTQCIMVGDPKQLPATVRSNTASKFLYECSMFECFRRAGHPVMLTKQELISPRSENLGPERTERERGRSSCRGIELLERDRKEKEGDERGERD